MKNFHIFHYIPAPKFFEIAFCNDFLKLFPANISTSIKRFRLIWSCDVAQRQINVQSTLCTSALQFTTFNNAETRLCISTLNWTMLDNVKTTFSFWTSIFTTLGNVETTLRIWPFEKKSLDSKTKEYFWASKNMLDSQSSSFFPHFNRNL